MGKVTGFLEIDRRARPDDVVSQTCVEVTEAVRRAIHDLVQQFGGSFSAEHGIGRLKVGELERYTSPVELSVMRTIKRALDPNHIMNPGKVLRHP